MCNVHLVLTCWLLSGNRYIVSAGGKIRINDPADVTDQALIDHYIDSYPVVVGGRESNIDMFEESMRDELRGMIRRGSAALPMGEIRGIPPTNWARFKGPSGEDMAIFSYKSVHRCVASQMEGSNVVDALDMGKLKDRYGEQHDMFYMSRSAVAKKHYIHTVTTEMPELYIVEKTYSTFTKSQGAHSDIRVIPFTSEKNCYYDRHPILKNAKYVLSGSAHSGAADWTEQMFLALMDDNFNIIISWLLTDPDTIISGSRSQKNWLPFWDKCKLMLSKRFGPQHVVSEFTHLRSSENTVSVPTTISTLSPAEVPSDYMIRGSAPVVHHPLFEKGLVIGCVHLRGKFKVYRHALFVMETNYPYHILSYSPLFTFKPYRNIEFVMSLTVNKDNDLELSHGSSDCEPRIALLKWKVLKSWFGEYESRTF